MTDTQKILEEFDKEFMQPDNYPWMGTDVTGNEIKKFLITKIQEAVAEERERIVEIVEGKKKKRQIPLNEKVMDRVYDCDVAAYNQGIDDVLSLLKEELTKKD